MIMKSLGRDISVEAIEAHKELSVSILPNKGDEVVCAFLLSMLLRKAITVAAE
jgi:hypothetical protein